MASFPLGKEELPWRAQIGARQTPVRGKGSEWCAKGAHEPPGRVRAVTSLAHYALFGEWPHSDA